MKKSLFFNVKIYFTFLLFLICCFFPLGLAHQDIKNIKASLKVNVKRNTPPLIALADENISPSFQVKKIQPPLLTLPFQKRKLFVRTKDPHAVTSTSSKRIIHIKKPLLISSKIIEAKPIKTKYFKGRPLKTKPLKTLHLKGIRLSSVETLKSPHIQELKNHKVVSQIHKGKSERVIESIIKPVTLSSTSELSGFEKRWFAYIQDMEEKKRFSNTESPSLMSQQKWVGDIWVGLPGQKPSPKPDLLFISQGTSTSNRESFSNEKPSFQYPPGDTNMISASSMASMKSSDRNLQEKLMNLPPIKVLGDITLLNGLGLLAGDELSVKYVNSCFVMYEADIDIRNGRFSIDVEDPSFGFLLAQLRNKDGLLRGSGQVSLREFLQGKLLENSNFADTIVEMDLKVVPFDHSSTVQIFNAGGDYREPLTDVSIEAENIGKFVKSDNNSSFSIPEILAGSSFITRIHREGLWKTLFLSTNDMSYDWEIPSNTLLTSLQKYVPNLSLDLGIIWGRVLKDNKPLEGVFVELADSVSEPYYLTADNQFIKGSGTTTTGYFAYVNVLPGIQLLRGRSEEVIIPTKILWTDRGHVSSVKLEETLRKEAEACVFDSQTGDLLSARVNKLGSDIGEVETQSGHLDLRFFNGADPLYFELRTNERGYHPMILMSHRNKNSISFPVPSRSWINELTARHKITQYPGLSIVVGYVSHSPFRAYIESMNDQTDIVYFSRDESFQEPLPHLQEGGFVLFNVDPGLHSVILEPWPSTQQKVAIKTLITDSAFVSVFSHAF